MGRHPPDSLSAVPHAGEACWGLCGCLDAVGTFPTGRTGQGRWGLVGEDVTQGPAQILALL